MNDRMKTTHRRTGKDHHTADTQAEGRDRKNKETLPHSAMEDIRNAVEVMQNGGIILYPTDTVWGLGCDATNPEAVARIYAIKQRADSKALITLVDSEAKVEFYVRNVPPVSWDLIELSTRPITIIYENARNLAANLMAEDGTAGIRITHEPFSKTLCMRFRKAIVSTSANISGQPAPKNFKEISDAIKSSVDYIVGYRQQEKGNAVPSTIIKIGEKGDVKVIRP